MPTDKKFKHEEYFSPLHEIVMEKHSPCQDIEVYRTVLTEETSEIDITPIVVRNFFDGKKTIVPVPENRVSKMTETQKQKMTEQLGISVNNTYSACLNSVKEIVEKKKLQGIPNDEIKSYIEDQRGVYIRRFKLNLSSGYISEFNKDHANFYPYEGFVLKDFIDPSFPPIRIPYEDF